MLDELTQREIELIISALTGFEKDLRQAVESGPMAAKFMQSFLPALFGEHGKEMSENLEDELSEAGKTAGPLLEDLALLKAKLIIRRRELEKEDKKSLIAEAIKASKNDH